MSATYLAIGGRLRRWERRPTEAAEDGGLICAATDKGGVPSLGPRCGKGDCSDSRGMLFHCVHQPAVYGLEIWLSVEESLWLGLTCALYCSRTNE